jgi:hypothetical protein
MLTQTLGTQTASLEAHADDQAQLNQQVSALSENCDDDLGAIVIEIDASVAILLLEAARQAQAWYEREQGEYYAVVDLAQAFTTWIEGCVEDLASDAFEHCLAGDRTYAFNRRAFKRAVAHLDPEQGSSVTH